VRAEKLYKGLNERSILVLRTTHGVKNSKSFGGEISDQQIPVRVLDIYRHYEPAKIGQTLDLCETRKLVFYMSVKLRRFVDLPIFDLREKLRMHNK